MKNFSGLTLFAKIVELKSFAEASRQLQLPTTTLSRKIQQLEAELGGKLLNRSTRSLSLTELGERVLPKALLILDTLKELQTEAEDISTQPTGKLRIDAPRAFSYDVLIPLLSTFRLQYPGIKIELDVTNRIQDLTRGNIDFAFRIGELADSSLISLPLTKVDYELVVSTDWIKINRPVGHPCELEKYTTIRNHVDGFILPWQFSKDMETYQIHSEPDLLSDDLHVSLLYALKSTGIACLPFSLVKSHLENGKLISLLEDWDKKSALAYLVYPDRTYLPQKSKLFLNFIKSNLAHFRNLLSKSSEKPHSEGKL